MKNKATQDLIFPERVALSGPDSKDTNVLQQTQPVLIKQTKMEKISTMQM